MTDMRRLRAAIPFVAATLFVVGCSTRLPPPTPSVTTPLLPARTLAAEEPGPCPNVEFDQQAPLGPEFSSEFFPGGDGSEVIARDVLDRLAALYADPELAICNLFTSRGWRTALAADWRLRAVASGELRFDQSHILRLREEGQYDLRRRPPTLPLEVIFDIPDGAATTDLLSGITTTSAIVERVGFRIDLLFDGHVWRIDEVDQLSQPNRELLSLPIVPRPGPPCTRFVRDAVEAAFDDDAERGWCDIDGHGRTIAESQLAMITRYPCDSGQAAILVIGQPLGTTHDPLIHYEYVRDPAREFLDQGWLTAPYETVAELPDDAASTGWTNGNVDLWISPRSIEQAVYLVRGNAFERWPRAAREWGVIDCN